MRTKWMSWTLAVALSLSALAATAPAQERPAPGVREDLPGADRAVDGIDELDGLDLLLAADLAPGPGRGGRMGPGMRRGPGMDQAGGKESDFRAKLNLSDEQKAKLADIRDRRERAEIPVQGDLRIASLDLRKLMRADKPDARAIDAQIDRIASLRATLHKARVASMLDARAVLTPAQQKLMKEHRGGMMGHRMRDGHGRQDGPRMRMRHL